METLELLRPYLKYFLYLIFIIGFLFINKIFVTDPKLRAWLMQSFEENGKASGKALSAFVCTFSIIVGWFVQINYAPNHEPSEYFFWGIAGLVTSLYGIREVGKVMTTKYTGNYNGDNNLPPNINTKPIVNDPLSEEDVRKKWRESGSLLPFEEWKTQNGN